VTIAMLGPLSRAALQNLEANRQRIDDLNVYPVPDGDTGSNLVLTLRRIVEAIEESEADTPQELADEIFHVALRAGKGNSGVIFSQIVRGFARSLGPAGKLTSGSLAEAFRAGSDAAYRAVATVGPVEGTIITVAREMAEEAESAAAEGSKPLELLNRVLARGEDALARTPEMLDVLAHAGVVDAGGAGLVEVVRGVALAANGEEVPTAPVLHEELGADAVHQELSTYRYCTGFVVEGEGIDMAGFEAALAKLGDSLLVVGDETALKVHVHTDDPGAAISAATAVGTIDEVEIADMHAQTVAREARLSAVVATLALETGLVVVCQGAGNREIFENEHATVVEGGQTTNPTVGEIVDAIEATAAQAVLVLPNNSNVLLAAQEAAELTEKDVRVLPSRSIQAGLVALESYVATRAIDVNEAEMAAKLDEITTGEVTVASKDATLDGLEIRKGSFFGLVEGSAVSTGTDLVDVALQVVLRAADGRDSLVLVTGEDRPDVEGLLGKIAGARPDLEPFVIEGGQPHYPLLLAAQ
jgi:DAK2 domain fusion protein YloV